ncbi:MAG TPA: recombination mediator RecR [Acidobacteriota bacterium]|nr:recombination mediator RecR [Acidobacteriota bacterium]HQM61808.1 recombination mediator RecR [Acidobacteriota bacterium]
MNPYSEPLADLIDVLKRLPGIGAKSAQRIAFYMLRAEPAYIDALVQAIQSTRQSVQLCPRCNNYTNLPVCDICAAARRDHAVICVVEKPFDIPAIERSGHFHGTYHVLHGALSPINGIGPDDLKITNLLSRLKDEHVQEVIVATNPDVEGEATAIYLSRLLKPLDVRVSRIALGLPVGSSLEYADEVTISRALDGRTPL